MLEMWYLSKFIVGEFIVSKGPKLKCGWKTEDWREVCLMQQLIDYISENV